MPRYHFNIYDGYSSKDPDGTELADIRQAQREAVRLAGAVLDSEVDRVKSVKEWRLEVTDDTGLLLFQFDFTATLARISH